jgi:hypothetical protein
MAAPWEFLMSCGYRCYRLQHGRFEEIAEPLEFEDLYFLPPNTRP